MKNVTAVLYYEAINRNTLHDDYNLELTTTNKPAKKCPCEVTQGIQIIDWYAR